jgi:hypothetical protein
LRAYCGADSVRKGANKSLVAILKRLECRALAGSCIGFGQSHHPTDDAAGSFFGFVELGESAANTETLGVPGVNAGDEGADHTVKELRGKFSSDEVGNGFVRLWRNGLAEKVAKKGPFGCAADESTREEGGRTQRQWLKVGTDQDISGRVRRSLKQLIRYAEFRAELAQRCGAAEALRSKFEQEAVASDGLNDAAGAGRSFDQFCVDADFLKCVRADEPGNSAADHQCWDVTGHGVVSILARSESFRKEGLAADQLLFFEIGIENHGQITDEDAAEPGGANLAAIEEHEVILAEGF